MAKQQSRNSSSNNSIPGMSYLERMSVRYSKALTNQASHANNLWKRLKDGKWSYQDLGSTFVMTVETYYDLFTEALKGPNYAARPEWVHFSHKQKSGKPSATAEVEVAIDTQPDGTGLESTDFIDPMQQAKIPGTDVGKGYAYLSRRLTGDDKAILIQLDTDLLEQSRPGQYTSFIVAKGRSGQAPLVIVTLVIE